MIKNAIKSLFVVCILSSFSATSYCSAPAAPGTFTMNIDVPNTFKVQVDTPKDPIHFKVNDPHITFNIGYNTGLVIAGAILCAFGGKLWYEGYKEPTYEPLPVKPNVLIKVNNQPIEPQPSVTEESKEPRYNPEKIKLIAGALGTFAVGLALILASQK